MTKKFICLALGALLLALSFPVEAQQPKKLIRIGMLITGSVSSYKSRVDAFRQGLRELGYAEGHNVVIEYRHAEGKFERLPDLAAELGRLKVDAIVAAGGIQAIRAAKNATNTTPIVVTGAGDPVGEDLIASLARPGGNITGLSLGGYELYGKRLELLKETVPRVSRVAFFWHRSTPAAPLYLKEVHASAQVLGLLIQSLEVPSANDFESVYSKPQPKGARMLSPSP